MINRPRLDELQSLELQANEVLAFQMPIHDGAGLDTLEQYIYASRRQFISLARKDMMRDSFHVAPLT